ncbi:hypothetical protein H8N03_05355 [Ramlibacter sp. USB13]|uniref:SMODS-associating 2TM beta-strand rich effector domain-containing protein n=1 Tax=Ramlibacter cellulosilyticus TaxID=2764187 RepID=A0A923MN27_9BURK|nr:hypothetical protein [Ramlibacter cellulosilyticus]MBC5782360.1 hypothetical protein [Ramlibacter cellulosilyticus]
MWRVLPFQWLVYYFLFGLVLVFLLIWWMQGQPNYLKKGGKGLFKLFATLWTTVTVFTLVTILAGKFLWTPLASTRWFSDAVFADVSGDWEGVLQSAAAAQSGTRAPGDKVEVHIEQDFFQLAITFTSNARRTDSHTITVWPERDVATRRQRLWYIYEARTPGPLPGDPAVYQGAGFIDVRQARSGRVLDGLYWTNRNWQRNAHTAGIMRLHRAGSAPASAPSTVAPM